MAKYCELCGKSTVAGQRVQHHHSIQWQHRAPKTKRKFKPNVRKINVMLDGKSAKVQTCMKCYKRLRKNDAEATQAEAS